MTFFVYRKFDSDKKPFFYIFSNISFQSIISPSDNSGLPMLSSAENYQFPVLVEQMTYRTQLEKNEFLCNNWTFNDVLVRLLDIIAYPVKSKIENIHNRCGYSLTSINTGIHQKLIDNCCHLLARVLSEIIFQSAPEVKLDLFLNILFGFYWLSFNHADYNRYIYSINALSQTMIIFSFLLLKKKKNPFCPKY